MAGDGRGCVLGCSAALFVAFAAPAAADVYYVSPTGTKPFCTPNYRCSLATALEEAGDGDA